MFFFFPNTTPLKARWLHGLDTDLTLYKFDITNPDWYPPIIKFCSSDQLKKAIFEFRNPLSSSGSYRTVFKGHEVNDSDTKQLLLLKNIVTIVRDQVIKYFKLCDKANTSLESCPLITSETLPDDVCEKRQLMLNLAKSVLFFKKSPDEIVKAYDVNKTNLDIWVNIYLTHGPAAFFKKARPLTPEIEKIIVKDHFNRRASTVFTCARHCFFDQNRLKRMIKRYYQ